MIGTDGHRPLTEEEAKWLVARNMPPHADHTATFSLKPYGFKVVVIARPPSTKTFVCAERDLIAKTLEDGGWNWTDAWVEPELMPKPEFDLEDMELAEIIMEELK